MVTHQRIAVKSSCCVENSEVTKLRKARRIPVTHRKRLLQRPDVEAAVWQAPPLLAQSLHEPPTGRQMRYVRKTQGRPEDVRARQS